MLKVGLTKKIRREVKLEIVFFGSSSFSLIVLEGLYSQFQDKIVWIVTRPPSRSGRGLRLQPSCVEMFARANNLNVCYFDPDLKNKVRGKVVVLASYGRILPKEILDQSKMTFNVHPSLVPRYRGATPIETCLLNRDEKTGVSLIEIHEKMDAGIIFFQEKYTIQKEDNYTTVHDHLAKRGMHLTIQALTQVFKGTKLSFKKQDEKQVTYSQKIDRSLYCIDWNTTVNKVIGQVKAFAGRGYAYTYFLGKRLKIIDAVALNKVYSVEGGEIVAGIVNEGFIVACSGGTILVMAVQLEGKKIMDAWAFFCGYCRKGKIRLGENE